MTINIERFHKQPCWRTKAIWLRRLTWISRAVTRTIHACDHVLEPRMEKFMKILLHTINSKKMLAYTNIDFHCYGNILFVLQHDVTWNNSIAVFSLQEHSTHTYQAHAPPHSLHLCTLENRILHRDTDIHGSLLSSLSKDSGLLVLSRPQRQGAFGRFGTLSTRRNSLSCCTLSNFQLSIFLLHQWLRRYLACSV